jgi:hypothetical protein
VPKKGKAPRDKPDLSGADHGWIAERCDNDKPYLPYHKLFSLILRDIVFTVTSTIKFTMVLKGPTAEEKLYWVL